MLRQIKVTINMEVNINEEELILNELVNNKDAMNEYVNNEIITVLEDIDENKLEYIGLSRKIKDSHMKKVLHNIEEDEILENIENIQKNIVTKIKSIEIA
ncbi:hypothetical protein [Tepidibacter hydrothermalis]|uniref:Uncharacterized protein n=1 Tax=Tepidibacter hydrothermalis TaxID=3036126 RepID=A0ABY8ECJ3_9FIRM|nr:hypothetical protein [Tepidibacter hydrothermalis]WFD10656.1 hypothetical protein P4S50_00860 [Tepidibacter hydrothermalis]